MEPAAEREWTREEVARHNGMNSARIIIDNVVYDVTEFLEEHPGGAAVLLDNAGKDASRCFRDVGHSELAHDWRRQFRIGQLPPREHSELPAAGAPPASSAAEPLTLAALLHVMAPPAALALLAAAFYTYLL